LLNFLGFAYLKFIFFVYLVLVSRVSFMIVCYIVVSFFFGLVVYHLKTAAVSCRNVMFVLNIGESGMRPCEC
jgi:hypothetical protein